MKRIGILFCYLMLIFSPLSYSDDQPMSAEEEAYYAQVDKILESLTPQRGEIKLPNGVATLNVPDQFYYLDSNDSRKVLVDLWGNPPDTGEVLGMLFPSGASPMGESSWGVTIEYEEDGYVSDEDAEDIDYDELLSQMKRDTADENEQRLQQGYEPIELVGWAAEPFYDQSTHKFHWAKELKFGDTDINTLNYNIRVLGRKGVLVLNFIAGIEQKQQIDSELDAVLAVADFDQGSRYEDFNPDLDKVAAYGLGALVAGKLAAKTGLIAAALIFLKKFGVLIVAGIGVLIRKLFKRNKD